MTPEQAKSTTNQGFEPRPICITPPRWNPTSHRPVPAPDPLADLAKCVRAAAMLATVIGKAWDDGVEAARNLPLDTAARQGPSFSN